MSEPRKGEDPPLLACARRSSPAHRHTFMPEVVSYARPKVAGAACQSTRLYRDSKSGRDLQIYARRVPDDLCDGIERVEQQWFHRQPIALDRRGFKLVLAYTQQLKIESEEPSQITNSEHVL